MPSPEYDLESSNQTFQVGGEIEDGGEDEESAGRGGLGWYMIPRAALRRPEHTCKRSASLVEQPWRDKPNLPERPGSQAAGDIHNVPEGYLIPPNTIPVPCINSTLENSTAQHNGNKESPTQHIADDQTSTTSTATLSTSRVRDWLERSPPSSNTSTQSGSSGSLLLTAANLAGLRLEGNANNACGKEIDSVSMASSTHFTMVGGYGPSRSKQMKRSICAKHTVSVLVITTCSLFLLGLTAAVYYIDVRTKAVKYYS